ncbi:MAG: glycosyltransferase [Actinobacteria bacterium]|nr:glycosyltransferase [Actinomycetota bacterium]MTA78243.1 glycosyltransferase [Actinomycetota bacterium]
MVRATMSIRTPNELRVAVYDRFWSVAGGGETYAGTIAEVLSVDHRVDLISHEPVDLAALQERLGLDLSRVRVVVVDDCEPIERVSRGYDLLINATYRDTSPNGARRGISIVHFPHVPTADLAPWQIRMMGVLARAGRRAAGPVEFDSGFHPADVIRWQQVRWTNGRGVLRAMVTPATTRVLRIAVARFLPDGTDRLVRIRIDGEDAQSFTITAARGRRQLLRPMIVEIPIVGRRGGVTVELISETFIPDETSGNGDRRQLGVPVVWAGFGSGPLTRLLEPVSLLAGPKRGLPWLDTYDRIVANSGYGASWVTRLWNRRCEVLVPAITQRHSAGKAPIIVSVGRFFAAERGHSKKQLEMVRAFARLSPMHPEWELHLVGGCAPQDEPYLNMVRRAAEGLPVVFHIAASGEELDELYGRASIYWHATGLGENLDEDPERAEHFGITTVEAMSAGAVPIVIRAGGQLEIVREGIDGFFFADSDGLVSRTRQVIDDPNLRERLSAAAAERALIFGREAFERRLRAMVLDVLR